MVLKKIGLENYSERTDVYSKLIRGGFDFVLETHQLQGGQKLQLYFYRNHPRVQEFVEANDKHQRLTTQRTKLTNLHQLRLKLNDLDFMMAGVEDTQVEITEYNLSEGLQDFPRGKAAILIDIHFPHEMDNTKLISELKNYFTEE